MSSSTWEKETELLIEQFISRVKKCDALTKQIGTNLDNEQLRKKLSLYREEAKEFDKSVTRKLSSSTNNNASWTSVVERYNKYSKYWRELYRNSCTLELKHQVSANSKGLHTTDSVENIEQFSQVKGLTKYQSQNEVLTEIIKERNQEIKKIKEETVAVAELFQTTAKMLADQHELIEKVEQNLFNGVQESEDAVHNLAKAARYHNQASYLKTSAICGVIGGTFGLLLGPAGAIIGSGTGVAVGSLIGKNVENFHNSIVDKEVFEHHLKKKWVPDELISSCQHCNTPFTQVIRKHHCRNCGKIFCHSCSSHKIPFKIQSMDNEVMARVCDDCFTNHFK